MHSLSTLLPTLHLFRIPSIAVGIVLHTLHQQKNQLILSHLSRNYEVAHGLLDLDSSLYTRPPISRGFLLILLFQNWLAQNLVEQERTCQTSLHFQKSG